MARRQRRQHGKEETRFADVAPAFERFPGFAAKDFDAFQPHKHRDARANGERLVVKRKLAALGQAMEPSLNAAGLNLVRRTSLSHPYRHNGFRVASQWVYWGRSDKERAALRRILGAELGTDVDPTYHGVVLLVEIDERSVAHGLKIHPAAWWDAQNLKKRVMGDAAEALAFAELLNALPSGYAMTIGGWRKRYEAGSVSQHDVANYFRYFKPGETWLHLLGSLERERVLELGAELVKPVAERLAALAAVYAFASWSRSNDRILCKDR